MQAYVYKITRNDGLEYIGITINPKRRFREHRYSKRFTIGIRDISILATVDSYEEAELLEEKYIDEFDTFTNGLNMTKTGQGKNENCQFNTLGLQHTDKTKQLMSAKAIGRVPWNLGRKWDDATKEKFRKAHEGRPSSTRKFSQDEVEEIRKQHQTREIEFDDIFIMKNLKKSIRAEFYNLKEHEWVSPNGSVLTYDVLFCKFMSQKYNVTYQAMKNIINGIGYQSKV